MRVFVTGASGFVGGRLTEFLTARGREVCSISRDAVRDTFSPDAWERVLKDSGADAVVHLIARTHAADSADPSSLPVYRRINVDITRALMQASEVSGVRRFVYVSSIKAVGEETPPDAPFTEESPCRPEDSYGVSKREAEEVVLRRSSSLEAFVLRPPIIYGAGVKGNFVKLLRAVRKGTPLPFAGVRNARSMLFAGNLSRCIEGVLMTDSSAAGVYHVADEAAVSTPELVRRMAAAMGVVPRLFYCPPRLLEAAGALAGRGNAVKKLTRSLVVGSERIRALLGAPDLCGMDTALEQTARWFMEQP